MNYLIHSLEYKNIKKLLNYSIFDIFYSIFCDFFNI